MALFSEMSMDDYNRLVARNQQQQAQKAAQNLTNRSIALQAANQKKKGSLVDTLLGVATGIKDKAVDAYDTAKNIGKTAVGAINQIGANKEVENRQKDDSKRRNEIAKKYGFNSYSEAANSGNASDEFWNEIKGSAKETQQNLKNDADWRKSQVGNVQDINLNKAKGQALNTIDTVGMALGGGAGVAANILGGGIAGIGDEYKAAANENRDVNWNNARINAITGAAGGAAGSAASGGLGKLAGNNLLGKTLGSQLGQGIGSGAASGAASAATATALNGGSLQDVLSAAAEGAKGGAVAGGAMAGTMGLAGNAINKLRNRNGATLNTTNYADAPEAIKTLKSRLQEPQQQRIEAQTSTPTGIAIKDYNAGIENIPVRVVEGAEPVNGTLFGKAAQDTQTLGELYGGNNARNTKNGKYIDSVVRRSDANLPEYAQYLRKNGDYIDSVVRRADANLPEATIPTLEQRFKNNNNGMTLEQMIAKGDLGEGVDILDVLKNSGIKQPELAAIKNGAVDAQELMGGNPFTAYDMTSRQDLPLLNRQEYYNDTIGKIGRDSNANLRAEDIPSYMQDRLRNDAGKGFASNIDNETILRQAFGDNMDKADMYRLYEELASTPRTSAYTAENFANALQIDPELASKMQQQMLDWYEPTRKIDVQGGPAISSEIPVTRTQPQTVEPSYTESTLPAKQYEQAVAKMPEAETTTPTTVANNTAVQTEQPRKIAVDPANQARLEREMYVAKKNQGEALLSQYGTLERPYRRMVGGDPEGVLNTLYDDYGLKTPADVQYAAKHVTGKDGVVSKMTRELANGAENVPTALSESWLDSIIVDNGLSEAEMKSIKSQIQAVMNRTGENGYSDGATTLQTIKNLEGKIRDLKGQSGTYHNMSYADKCRATALQMVRDELTDRLWANADIKSVMTDQNLNKLRSMYKDNSTWQNFVNNKLANAKDGAELRALMKPLVNGGQIVEGAQMTAGSVGERIAGAAAKGGSAKGATKNIISVGVDLLLNSDKAKQKRAEKYAAKAKNAEAQLYGEAPVTKTGKLGAITEKAGKVGETAKNIAGVAGEKLGNATSRLNDTTAANIALGGTTLGNIAQKAANREIAQSQPEFARNRAEQAQAQTAYDQAANDYTTALANQQAAEQTVLQGQNDQGTTLNRIAQAMDLAMAAGDIEAYSQLADLYTQAYKINEMQNPTATKEAKDLTASQSKALAAQQQLQALAQMTPNAGTVVSNIPLLGNLVDLTGGNEYATASEALATTLGYLLSGANIKESEAKRIGKSYVPSVFDSEEVKQRKLAQAQNLINSYLGDTSMLQR